MRILITGGAGFIGCNAAVYFMERGHDVIVFDDLSRAGADENLEWILASFAPTRKIRLAAVALRRGRSAALTAPGLQGNRLFPWSPCGIGDVSHS